MKHLRFIRPAEEELVEAMLSYEARVAHLGTTFLACVEEAAQAIRAHPAAWPPLRPGVRHTLVSRFPYAVVYREDPDEIVVLAVMHGHRRPDYWKDRL